MKTLTHFFRYKLGLSNAETQTTEEERSLIQTYAKGKKIAAEIGVWHGVTTRCILRSMDKSGVFYAIDPYPAGRLGISLQQMIAHQETAKDPHCTIQWLRMTGVQAGNQMKNQIENRVEFLFIDGDHSFEGLKGDWETWSGLMMRNGIVCLHDSQSSLKRNIDDAGSVLFTKQVICKDSRFAVVDTVDSLTVLKRTVD